MITLTAFPNRPPTLRVYRYNYDDREPIFKIEIWCDRDLEVSINLEDEASAQAFAAKHNLEIEVR